MSDLKPHPPRPVADSLAPKFMASVIAAVVVGGIYFGRPVLMPLALAVLMSFALAPLVNLLRRLRLGNVAPVLISLALAIVILSMWTNLLARTYAWMVILGRRGLINDFLVWVGVTSHPIQLLNTRLAVYIAMIHVLLPFMVLPLYSSIRSLDWRLVQAANGLGAGAFGAFRQVILPLSMPGVAAGCILVFTLSIGFYITPALVGGPSDMMISMLIENDVSRFDWGAAAAMATVLLAAVLVLFGIFARFVPFNPVVRR